MSSQSQQNFCTLLIYLSNDRLFMRFRFCAMCFLLVAANVSCGQELEFEVPTSVPEEISPNELDETAPIRSRRDLPSANWLWLVVPGLVGWACWAQSRRDAAVAEVRAMSWHNAKLQEKADSTEELKVQLADTRTRFSDREAELLTVQQQLQARLKDNDATENPEESVVAAADPQLKAKCESQEVELAKLREQLSSKQVELETALLTETQLRELRTENSELTTEIAGRNAQLEKLQQDLKGFREGEQGRAVEQGQLQAQVAALEGQLQQSAQLESELRNQLLNFESQMSGLRQQIGSEQSSAGQLKSEVESLREQLTKSAESEVQLREHMSSFEIQVAGLKEQLDTERNRNVERADELDLSRQRLSQSQATSRSNSERLQAAYGEMASIRQHADTVTQQNESLTSQLESAATEVAVLNAQQQATRRTLTQIRASVNKKRRPAARIHSLRSAKSALASRSNEIAKEGNTAKPTGKPTGKPRKADGRKKPTASRMRVAAKVNRSKTKQGKKTEKTPRVKKKAASKKPTRKSPNLAANDQLTKIKGIGPKTAALLNAAGIRSFRDLVKTKQTRLRKILEQGGTYFQRLDSSKWPTQAANEINKSGKPKKKTRRAKKRR